MGSKQREYKGPFLGAKAGDLGRVTPELQQTPRLGAITGIKVEFLFFRL